jgi:hypothetical protein
MKILMILTGCFRSSSIVDESKAKISYGIILYANSTKYRHIGLLVVL